MPSYKLVTDFLYENFENVKVKGNQFTARCSLCGDSAKSKRKARFNLRYNDRDTIFHCWNCGASGSFYKLYGLIKKISTSDAYNLCESIGNNFDAIIKDFNRVIPQLDPKTENFNWILKDCLYEHNYEPGLINEGYITALKNFRKSRLISNKIPLYISYRGKYKGRIIIPVFNKDGNIIYFQARSTIESIQPKYLNPEFSKEVIIPNFDFFDTTKPVIIVEGLIDSYSIGTQSTSCLGKEIDDNFLRRILYKCKNIIIALDNDESGKRATLNLAKNSKFAFTLQYFTMPYDSIKDINQLLVQKGMQNINMYEFILSNSDNYFNYMSKNGGCLNEIDNTRKGCYLHK